MNFDWDEKKNLSNYKKHGIRFEEVIEVFKDTFALEATDEFNKNRLIRTGFTFHKGVLFVVYEENNESIRIISARKSTKSEAKQYAQRIRS